MLRPGSGNFLSSGDALRIRAASEVGTVCAGAATIARVLEPTSGRLTELLNSGSSRNLSEAFQQLNPSEQNHLRERWGRSLDELISLSSERDATIFHHGLLEVGHRLEDADQLELASVVYSALVASNAPRPPLVRAQARLNAMNGVGDWRARLAFNLERLPSNATRWDMLFAMGGAGLVFRGVRLAATARWASSFESAFALNAAATSTAFLSETAAFTGFGRLFGTMAGHHYDWSAEGTFNEWAGGATMLLGLKAMGGIFGNLSNRWAAGETAFARLTRAVAPQVGMFAGILTGNRLAELGGFYPERHGDTWLTDGLTTLLEFNVVGRLQRSASGPGLANLEGRMEAYTQAMAAGRPRVAERLREFMSTMGVEPQLVTAEGIWMSGEGPHPPSGHPLPGGEGKDLLTQNAVFSVRHEGGEGGGRSSGGSKRAGELFLEMPRMGVRDPLNAPGSRERAVRENAELVLRELIPEGRVLAEKVSDPAYVSDLLKSFGITQHSLDLNSFRDGFELARENPERVRALAFDVDEVILHWSLNTGDLFSGSLERGVDAYFHRTAPDLLRYEPFQTGPGGKLNFFQRLWFNGIQGLLQGRMRQHIQFHPGVRAYQLGLRLGLGENLNMVTTGPAGRILMLVNEDPALAMIFSGKTPSESVTIDELRDARNIYTREHLVLAMRRAASGEGLEIPGMESYLSLIRENPKAGEKLKHPVLAGLLDKNPFSILVDDSSTTFGMLRNLEGFTVLQPPSARPSLTLNFVLGSSEAYLERMANGYVRDLAQRLSQVELNSQKLSEGFEAPGDYPYQRFTIEIPWNRFAREFVAPARELKFLARHIRTFDVPALLAASKERAAEAAAAESRAARIALPLKLNESERAELTARLQWELQQWTRDTGTEVAAQVLSSGVFREMATESPQAFEKFLARHLTEREREHLPGAALAPEARGDKYYSRIAGIWAAKRSVFKILGMDLDSDGRELEFRFGHPLVEGEAKRRMFERFGHLHTSMASDGDVGVGMAFFEKGNWESGLVGFGIDVTTDRVRYTTPELHALAESAFKATLRTHTIERFNHHRVAELKPLDDGAYALTGKTMLAARILRGDPDNKAPLPIRATHFRLGDATVAMVGIPALRTETPPSTGPGRIESTPAHKTQNADPAPVMSEAELARQEFLGMGPESPIERRLRDGRPVDSGLLGEVVDQILESLPPGPGTFDSNITGKPIHTMLLNGEIRYRRLEALHRLLLNGKSPTEAIVVDNGPGPLVSVSAVLARLGARVLVKDLPSYELRTHRRHSTMLVQKGLAGSIEHVDLERLDDPVSADIVYWTNPHPANMRIPREASLIGYLGRDVRPGAFLVLQTDHHGGPSNPYQQILKNPEGWDVVYDAELPDRNSGANFVMPTGQHVNLHLQIFRRHLNNLNGWVGMVGPVLPYRFDAEGGWELPESGLRVTVVDDVDGARSFELASRGHRVVHIQPNAVYLREARRRIANLISASGRPTLDFKIDYYTENAVSAGLGADLVEVYYPETEYLRFEQNGFGPENTFSTFLQVFLNSKLGHNGRALYLVSRDEAMVRGLAERIEIHPGLQLIKEGYSEAHPPLIGGIGHEPDLLHSWLLYRRRP